MNQYMHKTHEQDEHARCNADRYLHSTYVMWLQASPSFCSTMKQPGQRMARPPAARRPSINGQLAATAASLQLPAPMKGGWDTWLGISADGRRLLRPSGSAAKHHARQ